MLLELGCLLAQSQRSTNLFAFLRSVLVTRQPKGEAEGGNKSCPVVEAQSEGLAPVRLASRRAEEVATTGGLATQTSAEASAGACLNRHRYSRAAERFSREEEVL